MKHELLRKKNRKGKEKFTAWSISGHAVFYNVKCKDESAERQRRSFKLFTLFFYGGVLSCCFR